VEDVREWYGIEKIWLDEFSQFRKMQRELLPETTSNLWCWSRTGFFLARSCMIFIIIKLLNEGRLSEAPKSEIAGQHQAKLEPAIIISHHLKLHSHQQDSKVKNFLENFRFYILYTFRKLHSLIEAVLLAFRECPS